ncbi:ubiquitin carboxyl-terminal hydrolase [Anaeramoeba flamelloides]|uniref:Ubiquitin carboxyl-terminal hydrolase n=1 Tax=Anaeramoeba flamelloides TaxID=1746091 RepID=A0AAV7YJ08_9EUKA|nr:ubiquitin carboxyl-terminal hydrolase [Anaeramoeba flamelloides]
MIPKKNNIFEDIEKIQESEDTPAIHIILNTNELNLRQSIVSQNQENYLKISNVLEPFSNNNFIDSNKKNPKIKEKEKLIDNTINQITMSENIKNKNKKSIPNQIHSCFSEGDENKKVENTSIGFEDDYLKQFEDILIKPTILYEDDFKTMKITEIKRNLLGADIAYGKRDIPSIDDQEDEIKVISPKKQTKLIKKLNSLRSHDININLQLTNENIFLYLRKNKETKKLTDIQQSVNIIGINNFDNLCYFNAIIHSLLFVDIIEQTLENIHIDSSNALLYIIKKIKNSVGKNSTRIRTTYNKIQSAYLLLLSKLGYNNNKMQSYKVGLNLIKKIFMYADNYFRDFTNDYYLKIKEQKFSYFTDKLLLRNVNIIQEKFLIEKKFEKLFLHEDKKNKLFIQRISDSIIFF